MTIFVTLIKFMPACAILCISQISRMSLILSDPDLKDKVIVKEQFF